jgi:hypothetical protein
MASKDGRDLAATGFWLDVSTNIHIGKLLGQGATP